MYRESPALSLPYENPNYPHIDSAKTDKTRFRRFWHYAPAYFWQSEPETPRQLDTVDALDAKCALQGLEKYDLRRPRRVRRLDGEFLPPCTPYFFGIQQYIGPRVPRKIHKGAGRTICDFTQWLSEVLQSGNLWRVVTLVLPSIWGGCFAQQHRLTIS